MNNILNGGGFSDFFSTYGMMIFLIGCIVILMGMSFMGKKKENQRREELFNSLKTGAKIITSSGVYGTIISITETTDGKVVLISTGDKKYLSYQEIHINAIMGIDNKKAVVYDEDGNDITPLDDVEPAQEIEEKQEKEVETKPLPKKKSPAKKSTK